MDDFELTVKTNEDSSPINKQKIFLSYAYQDKELMLEKKDHILSLFDCAIYFIDHQKYRHLDPKKAQELIASMDVFVPIVTSDYLDKNCFELTHLFPYAKKKHMEIMPLIQDKELSQEFNDKCGNIQFIDDSLDSNSVIKRDEMIKDYFRYINPSKEDKELINKVKKAFVNKIFLSYRKRDKEYLKQVLELINEHTDSLFDTGLWYDENLSVGKKYDHEIDNKIKEANIFVLLVTNNLFEPNNYVLVNELPLAIDFHKTIIPVYLDEYDKGLYQKYCPELSEPVSLDNLIDEIVKNLKPFERTAEQNNLIGIGYLYGWGVFKNPDKAKETFLRYVDEPNNAKSLAAYYRKYEPDEIESIAKCDRVACYHDLDSRPEELNNSLFTYISSLLDVVKKSRDEKDIDEVIELLHRSFIYLHRGEVDLDKIHEIKKAIYKTIKILDVKEENSYGSLYSDILQELEYIYTHSSFNYEKLDVDKILDNLTEEFLLTSYNEVRHNSVDLYMQDLIDERLGEYSSRYRRNVNLSNIYENIEKETSEIRIEAAILFKENIIRKALIEDDERAKDRVIEMINKLNNNIQYLKGEDKSDYIALIYALHADILLKAKMYDYNFKDEANWLIKNFKSLYKKDAARAGLQLMMEYYLIQKNYRNAFMAEMVLIKNKKKD